MTAKAHTFNAGDKVMVEYNYGKFYEGEVLWSEFHMGYEWVTVRPDDDRYISTFGSARDMSNRWKSYIVEIAGRKQVIPAKVPA